MTMTTRDTQTENIIIDLMNITAIFQCKRLLYGDNNSYNGSKKLGYSFHHRLILNGILSKVEEYKLSVTCRFATTQQCI